MLESRLLNPVQSPNREEVESLCSELTRLKKEYLQRASRGTPEKLARDHIHQLHDKIGVAQEELLTQIEQLAESRRSLEIERQRYFELFEHALDPSFVTDRLGVIQDVNLAARALLGAEMATVRGKPLALFVDRDTVTAFRSATNALATRDTTEAVLRIGDRKASYRWVRLVGRRTSSPHRMLWVGRDCEPALPPKMVDAEISIVREVAPSLGGLEDPTGMLSQAAAVLRDMKRPDMSADDRLSSVALLEELFAAQAGLLATLLDFARVVTDRIVLDEARVDLGDIVGLVGRAVEGAAADAGLTLTLAVKRGLHVRADEVRLTQIVLNLLSNAIRHTPRGGTVQVATREEGGRVALSVRDSGVGLDGEAVSRIADGRGAPSDEGGAGGLGVGLCLTKRLVEAHGGELRVTSEGLGKGAHFEVLLPAV